MADLPRSMTAVAAGLRDVARVAAEGDGARELVHAALDALRASLPFTRAAYLSLSGDELRPRLLHPAGDVPEGAVDAGDHPGLGTLFAAGRAVSLVERERAELATDLALAMATEGDETPYLLVPIKRGGDPAGVVVLSTRDGNPPERAHLEIATVYGAFLGLGLAAVERADRLEQLREALQERNELLAEEVSADADACRSLEASISRPMRRLVQMAKQVATTDAPVLITGETGSGKEVLARAIHEWSARAEEPFVQLNCAALSDHLIESELFGHVKGAFSGAVSDRAGRFRVADGGTLLLDEIGEMPLDAQTKLLRVLEEGEVLPVGSDHTAPVDVRVIAATNVDLEQAIDRGRFREDLYFRLHVFPLRIPPLRERIEDLEVLIEQVLARIRRRTGHGPWRVTAAQLEKLRRYPWPGNVRELVNALERARVYAPLGGTLNIEVGHELSGGRKSRRRRDWPTLEQHQRTYIEDVLRHTGGKIYGDGGAAELLGLPPSTLQSRMKRLGVERPG